MIYLDNSATTRTMGVAAEAAKKYMTEEFFNPAAAYSPAVREERAVNGARKTIGSAINAGPDEIIFTSGGTESNNMAILGSLKAMRGRGRIIVGSTEHPSVYEVYKSLACQYDVVEAPVDNTGMIDLKRLESLITPDTRLVSVMQVNNEVGAVNDAEAIRRILRRRSPEALLHVDGVQGFLKVPFDAKNCDLYSISGHKIHAPKGIGALYIRAGLKLKPFIVGGSQESGMRAGTEAMPQIAAFGAASEIAYAGMKENIARMSALRERAVSRLERDIPELRVISSADSAPHILSISLPGWRSEVLMNFLEARGVYVSRSSACKKGGRSHVLETVGLDAKTIDGAIRVGLSRLTTEEDIDALCDALRDAHDTLAHR